MRFRHTLFLGLMFSVACIEAPPDEGTDPNNISDNNIGNNVVTTNNTTVSSNSRPNNTSTNNSSTNNTNNQTNSTTNNEPNNSTITGQYTVTLTPNQIIPGARNVPLYVVLDNVVLPEGNFALEGPSSVDIHTEMDARLSNRLAFWVRWPDLGSLDPITLNVIPSGDMFNRLTWEGFHAVWHMRNGPMDTILDSTQNPTNLNFEDCQLDCSDNEVFLGRALKTRGFVAATSATTINLANDWSLSFWVRLPTTAAEIHPNFITLEDQNQNKVTVGLSITNFILKTGNELGQSTTFAVAQMARFQQNQGWYHIAVQSRNGDLFASLNGSSFIRGETPLTSPIQGQVNVRISTTEIPLSFDEVWIGNTSAANLNAIYQNQLQALPNGEDPLVINAELTFTP